MTSKSINALLEAKPPATDPFTYLTIVEYNLSTDVLPTLHDILQDTDLTTSIGWDLVHLLLPLLPASQECLQDVARLGNPREVVLKVTEALRLLDFDVYEDDEENDEDIAVTAGEGSASTPRESSTTQPPAANVPRPVMQFQALVSMLAVLHPRIKTKYPSRFLSTSLQAVLVAYKNAGPYAESMTESVIHFVKAISGTSGTKRPTLPSRTSSSLVLTISRDRSAPDPEGTEETVTNDETALQQKLLQSFMSHLLEDYLASLSSDDDVPGMAWSSRLEEKLHKDKIPDLPGRTSFVDRFSLDEAMQARSSTVGQIVAIADDLNLKPSVLLKTVLDYDPKAEDLDQGDEPPDSAEDVPFSEWGALFLFAASIAKKMLYTDDTLASPISVFPHHARILDTYFGDLGQSQSEASVDAVIFLGLFALESKAIGDIADDETFNNYLLKMSYFAVNSPSPSLRYNAHLLTSTILHSHPSDTVRLSFISDTLEHCPYESLKATAVGWLKDEIIKANLEAEQEGAEDSSQSIFASPVALSRVAEFLFPDLSMDLASSTPLPDAWMHFNQSISFYLSTLSFYYILLRAEQLQEPLNIVSLHKTSDVGGSYLAPLKAAVERFGKALTDGELDTDSPEDLGRMRGELALVEDNIDRIEEEVKKLN